MNLWWLSYRSQLVLIGLFIVQILLIAGPIFASEESLADIEQVQQSKEEYGPHNLLKTMRTPFTTEVQNENNNFTAVADTSLIPIAISVPSSTRHILTQRLHGPKLFLPSGMVLGQPAEFNIKGEPDHFIAIAMSENNKGAKPVYGHNLRLAADRKLVALGKIPETGMLSVFVETPIEGDLIGGLLYFECAIWSKPDFSDIQMASTISTTQDSAESNGVLVAGQPEEKKHRAVVFDVKKPLSTREVGGLSSGKP